MIKLKSLMLERRIKLFRGESIYNRNGNFYATNREQARQYTQSGRDSEIRVAYLESSQIYKANPLPFAGNENEMTVAMQYATTNGFGAIWADEGQGEQPSIFVIDKTKLTR